MDSQPQEHGVKKNAAQEHGNQKHGDQELRVVLVTCPVGDAPKAIARALVQESLAACVNILPQVQSVYRWEGSVEEDFEDLLVIKTSAANIASLEDRVHTLHPYSTPEFVVLNPSHVAPAYHSWLVDSVAAASARD